MERAACVLLPLLSIAFAGLLPSGSAQEQVIASGHLDVGTTGILGFLIDYPDHFAAPIPGLEGATLATRTTDHGGVGHQVTMRFTDGDGFVGADCTINDGPTPVAMESVCVVPAGATEVWVSANLGLDLDVDVLRVA